MKNALKTTTISMDDVSQNMNIGTPVTHHSPSITTGTASLIYNCDHLWANPYDQSEFVKY